jgi:hypothetical protein
MAGNTSAQTIQQQLDAAVDALAQIVENPPPIPDRVFLRTVDGLEHTIDRLVGEAPIPTGDRVLDQAADTLADTIDRIVHAPPTPQERPVLDTLAHAMDTLVHIGDAAVPAVQSPAADVAPPPPDQGPLLGVDTLAGTVATLADLVLVSPGPYRELADMVDVLAHEDPIPAGDRVLDHTISALAFTAEVLAEPVPEGDRGVDAIRILAHTVDALVDAEPVPEGDRGLVHAADALTRTVDAFTHEEPIRAGDRVLDRGIHTLAHTIDAVVHTLPLIDPAEDAEHVAAIDDAVHAIDVALRGGPDGQADLLPAVQSLARAVGEIIPCVMPAPESGLDLALGTLGHTVDFLAHQIPVLEGNRVLVTGIDTLVQAISTLVHGAPIEGSPGGGAVSIGTPPPDIFAASHV